jgi:hypothetical protein
MYVHSHPIAKMEFYKITRRVVLDCRDNLLEEKLKEHPETVNTVITALKATFNEGKFRGELQSNPFTGNGSVKCEAIKRNTDCHGISKTFYFG